MFIHIEASRVPTNNIIPNIDETENIEIKTEPYQWDELYSDGDISNMVDNNSTECFTESKIYMSFIKNVEFDN